MEFLVEYPITKIFYNYSHILYYSSAFYFIAFYGLGKENL